MTSHRTEKIGDQLLGFLAEQLMRLTDPRLQYVSFTALKVSPDLKLAHIYWSAFPVALDGKVQSGDLTAEKKSQISEALIGAAKLFKRRIADELQLRHIPELIFHYDETLVRGQRIEELLAKVSSGTA